MPRSSCLTLVVPDLLADTSRTEPTASHSLLARLAGRGRCVRRWMSDRRDEARLHSWQRGLLAILELDERSYSSAPSTAKGVDLDPGAKHWFHVEAVHFAAGLNEMTLVPLRGANAVTAEESAALAAALRQHLDEAGLTLHDAGQCWLSESASAWDVDTVTAEFARSHEWSDALPQGTSAGKLRRLMTELQMLLHEHPVNQSRNARGVPAANAVWFWGNGSVSPTAMVQRAECAGRNAFLRGICRLHDWRHSDDVTAGALMAQSDQASLVVAVIEARSLQEFEARWLIPLVDGLKRSRFATLRLIIDEWELSIGRWQLKAFWRKDRPLETWGRA